MLFLLFGSSGAGKTTVLGLLRGTIDRLATHDFDEVGVPPGATIAWRREQNERWLMHALALQGGGNDLLLASQTPLGELLAAPSARRLDGIAGCLLDCDDATRVARLAGRGEDWLAGMGGSLDDVLAWAEWMRGHARDPSWRPDVLGQTPAETSTRAATWRVNTIDTSTLSPDAAAEAVRTWIEGERAARS